MRKPSPLLKTVPGVVILLLVLLACRETATPTPTTAVVAVTPPAQPLPPTPRTPAGKPSGRCGDGTCDGPETTANCPQDCESAKPAEVQPVLPTLALQSGSETATVPLSQAGPDWNSPFGISEGVSNVPIPIRKKFDPAQFPARVAENVQKMSALGTAWYRIHTTSYGAFPFDGLTRDNFSFARQDEEISGLQAANIAMIIMLGPRPGNDHPCGEPYLPADLEGYKAYVTRVVERYDGDGVEDMPGLRYGIHYWQMDNEVDLHWFGCMKDNQSFSTPEEYVAALEITSGLVRQADPQATIFPSFAEAGNPTNKEGAAYFEQFIKLGGLKYVDGIDTHDYSFKLENLLARLENINRLTAADPKPIWVMETSVPSDPRANAAWDETKHARAVVEWHIAALAVPNVQKIFWYSLAQSPGRPEDREWTIFGSNSFYDCQDEVADPQLGITICPQSPLTPGGYTYQLMTARLKGFVKDEKLADGVYRVTLADGRAVFILWAAAPATIDLTPYGLSGEVSLTKIIEQPGATAAQVMPFPANAVPVDESPVFLEAN